LVIRLQRIRGRRDSPLQTPGQDEQNIPSHPHDTGCQVNGLEYLTRTIRDTLDELPAEIEEFLLGDIVERDRPVRSPTEPSPSTTTQNIPPTVPSSISTSPTAPPTVSPTASRDSIDAENGERTAHNHGRVPAPPLWSVNTLIGMLSRKSSSRRTRLRISAKDGVYTATMKPDGTVIVIFHPAPK